MLNIILLVKNMQRPVKIHLSRTRALAVAAVLIMPVALAAGLGFYWGAQQGRSEALVALSETGVVEGNQAGNQITREMREHLNALVARLGSLQAHVIRLDAVGRRLVDMAGLDNGEFNFENPPAQGGPEIPLAFEPPAVKLPGLQESVDALDRQLEDRAQQFSVLESLLMNRNLMDSVLPAGRPVEDGWVSSYFGIRSDPFTGRRVHHAGIDIAGKQGAPIEVVGSGVVIFSGARAGYGNLVEVNHGNGYITRYGHNQVNLVKEGDKVNKGQVLALMGSTGRSTGPHLHFEVLRNGKVVNPIKYLSDAR